MTTTTPDTLWSPDLTTGFVPTTDLAHMQDTVQTALNNKPVNYRIGTDSGRVTPVGWTPSEGMQYYSTDTDTLWFHNGSIWARGPKPTLVTPTFTTIYSSGTPAARLVQQGGRNYLQGVAASTTASFAAGTYYDIATIPVALAPAADLHYAAMLNGVFGAIRVASTGVISFFSSVVFTGVLTLHLGGASWPDKNL